MGLAARIQYPSTHGAIENITSGWVRRSDIKLLLQLTHPNDLQYLFAAARKAREIHFGREIFLYGFLYFSTYCRNDCTFCQYRRSNRSLPRYRKSKEEILSAANEMAASNIHLIDLTMGEDPFMFSFGSSPLRRFGDIALAVRAETGLPIMVSPGVLLPDMLRSLASEGIEWYACYQETHNRKHFSYLRKNQCFNTRLERKRSAKEWGMLIEEGILLGSGESVDDITDSLLQMMIQDVDQVRAMTFVPHSHVTIQGSGEPSTLREHVTIAVMRLLMPHVLIPASLDVEGLKGLASRLDAGANVITSIVPPSQGLAGVANQNLDIEDARRSLDRIIPIVQQRGLKVAAQEKYKDWLTSRRAETHRNNTIPSPS